MNRPGVLLEAEQACRLQDEAFAEVARVLRLGGTFADTGSIGRGRLFHAIHIGDTLNLIDPDALLPRLGCASLGGARGEARRHVVPLAGDQAPG